MDQGKGCISQVVLFHVGLHCMPPDYPCTENKKAQKFSPPVHDGESLIGPSHRGFTCSCNQLVHVSVNPQKRWQLPCVVEAEAQDELLVSFLAIRLPFLSLFRLRRRKDVGDISHKLCKPQTKKVSWCHIVVT